MKEDVLTFIGRRVANTKGDARQACSFLCLVADEWQREENGRDLLAGVSFAKKTMDQSCSPSHKEIFDALPMRQKELLAVITKLYSMGREDIRSSNITRIYVDEMFKRSREDASDAIEYVPLFLSSLKDYGLISYTETSDGYPADHDTITLEISPVIVVSFMDRLVGKFYAQIGI